MDLLKELRVKEYAEAIELLDDLRGRVERGEVMTVLALCECTDGTMAGSCTTTKNVFTMAGYMLAWALRRIGFAYDQPIGEDADEV